MKNNSMIIFIIIALIIGIAAFYGGMMYQKSQFPMDPGQFAGGPGGGFPGGNGSPGGGQGGPSDLSQ